MSVCATEVDAQRRPARTPAPPAVAPEQTPAETEYVAVIGLAMIEYEGGRWAEARVLFARAHALLPNARTLRGMGMCAFEMRDYVNAILAMSEALTHPVRPLDPEQRTTLERSLAQAHEFVGKITLEIAPATATVTIDGLPPVQRDGVALVNPGTHEVHVEAPDLPSAERRILVESGATVPVQITLRLPPVVRVLEAPPERIRPHPVRLPSAIAYGVGGVGLGLFAGFGIRAIVIDGNHEAGCLARGTCTEAQLETLVRSTRVADVGLGLMVAGTATGLLLQLLHTEPGRESTPTVGAALDRTTGMVVVGGQF